MAPDLRNDPADLVDVLAIRSRPGTPLISIDGTELAARIVNSRRYPVEQMVTHTFPLCEAPAAIGLFKEGRDDVIHVALDPWQ